MKKILKRYIVCKRYQGSTYATSDSTKLPIGRVADVPPFANTGVDFIGPLYTKTLDQSMKVYVCLFTCATTHAMHLEFTDSLGASQFLQVFHCFAS